MIKHIRLVKSVGLFDNVSSGAGIELRKLTLGFAENGRGKTTVAAILRSLGSGEALPINERRRLGATNAPEVIIECDGGTTPAIFRAGTWSRTCPEVVVFDDEFVDRNVYSGMEVQAGHRQNLHELILGAHGVALAQRVDELAGQIRELSTDLREKSAAIPVTDRNGLSVDDFCGLPTRADIDEAITAARQRLGALEQAESVRGTSDFAQIALPAVDLAGIRTLLATTVADLDRAAADAVKAHFTTLGESGEGWIATGMRLGADGAALEPTANCPFCKQALTGSPIFNHYRAYFGEAYTKLQADLFAAQTRIETALKGDALAGFERQVRTAEQRRTFWAQFAAIPEVVIDTVAIATAWQEVRDAVLSVLRVKRSDPLTAIEFSADAEAKLTAYEQAATGVARASAALIAANEAVRRAKETARGGNAATARVELNRLLATKARHQPVTAALCTEYLTAEAAKATAEAEKVDAQRDLDAYRATVFPASQTAINTYLSRLNAGFQVQQVQAQPTGGRPSITYQLVINAHVVPVGASNAAAGAPTFKNTLSAGDRNTLALAFFLAALERDPDRARRVVVLDDPMSSLDRHRRRATIQEIRTLLADVAQVIVLSHDEHFLFDVFDRVPRRDPTGAAIDTTTLEIKVAGAGSTLQEWDIVNEKMGNHDKRHALLTLFAKGEGGDPRKVAEAIRPHIERYLRTCCPDKFKDGEMLRDFRNRAIAAERAGTPIMSPTKRAEMDQLVEYGNDFHHDTNPATDTVRINEAELRQFASRTLAFVSPS